MGVCGGARVSDTLQLSVCVYPSYAYSPPRRHVWGCGGVRAWVTLCNLVCVCLPHMPTVHQEGIPLKSSVCVCILHMPTVHQEGMSWGVKCADEGAPMLHLSYHDGMVCFSHVQVRIRYVNLRWVVIKRKMSKGICYVNLHWLLD